MIGTMVGDVLAETERRVREAGVETIDDVRAAGRPLAGFSNALAAEERELKRFLYARLYDLPELRPDSRGSRSASLPSSPPPIAPIPRCFRRTGSAAATSRAARAPSATSSPE